MLTSELGPPRSLLLDTHIWIWSSGNSGGPSRFAHWIAPQIEQAAQEERLLVCVASVWEIALKARAGSLLISGNLGEWVRAQREYPGVEVLAISSNLAIESTTLPEWIRPADGKEHKDPNDRFLVAAARRRNAVLITCDELILDYAAKGHVIACDARLRKRV